MIKPSTCSALFTRGAATSELAAGCVVHEVSPNDNPQQVPQTTCDICPI